MMYRYLSKFLTEFYVLFFKILTEVALERKIPKCFYWNVNLLVMNLLVMMKEHVVQRY